MKTSKTRQTFKILSHNFQLLRNIVKHTKIELSVLPLLPILYYQRAFAINFLNYIREHASHEREKCELINYSIMKKLLSWFSLYDQNFSALTRMWKLTLKIFPGIKSRMSHKNNISKLHEIKILGFVSNLHRKKLLKASVSVST